MLTHLRFHAVMLGARNVDASLAFYTEKLGFTSTGRFGDFAFIDAGGTRLMLSGELKRARTATGPVPVELVFAVESVAEAFRAYRERGLTFLNEPHPVDDTNHVVNFEDPDGHLLSLYGPP